MNPELSVAVGTVQFTSAENVSRSAYATKGLAGHGTSNDGGRISDTQNKMLRKIGDKNGKQKEVIKEVRICSLFVSLLLILDARKPFAKGSTQY